MRRARRSARQRPLPYCVFTDPQLGRIGLSEGQADEIDRVLTRNAIWVGRTVGLGVMTPEEATNWGLSGPMLRASGVDYDVRKDFPYLDYETYDFEVPVGVHGDVYDRYLVRFEEMRQSLRILQQAARRLPDGPVNIDDPRVIHTVGRLEDLRAMLKARGDWVALGNADEGKPTPEGSVEAIPKMVEGHLLSDVIAINASIDIVMGEIDR